VTRRARHGGVALATAVVVWLAQAGVAAGHALLLDSEPRNNEIAPTTLSRILLRFNSRLEPGLSRLWIVTPDGQRVRLSVTSDGAPNRLTAPVPHLAAGVYTLEWKVLSADGHVTEGGFRFRVIPVR